LGSKGTMTNKLIEHHTNEQNFHYQRFCLDDRLGRTEQPEQNRPMPQKNS
jgi:hypothetical protein